MSHDAIAREPAAPGAVDPGGSAPGRTPRVAARAFAYGGDVFLGPGESDRDVGLMAHELTHVVQQGAAGAPAPQRQVTVGAADSPAEREADAVAGAVTGGARPASLLVDDNATTAADGQMTVSAFIAQLRPAVTAAADEALGPGLSALGCPYIEAYFSRYATRRAEAAGVPIVIGFDDNVNSVFLSGTLDQFMSNLQAGQTFAAALSAANAQLDRQPLAMGHMVIHFASGYSSAMTLEEARTHHRTP